MSALSLPHIQVHLGQDYGWARHELGGGVSLHFKGYLNRIVDDRDAAMVVVQALRAAGQGDLSQLNALDGHFAAILEEPSLVVATVDRVRSIPLLLASDPQWGDQAGWIIADHAAPIMAENQLGPANINEDAARDLALAGYVIGPGSLYQNVCGLLPGEVAILRAGPPDIRRYALYRPWLAEQSAVDEAEWRATLRDLTLDILRKMIASARGRQILLPLSGGLDSRLIASGLRHLGYDNVVCFSYGRVGNHEADAAEKIAAKLGYPWHFLETTTRAVRQKRQSAEFARYMTLADSLIATPVEQDVFTIMDLHCQSWAARDGIIVNGQSGDFLTGGHIPASLAQNMQIGGAARDDLIFAAMLVKHLDLWPDLKTADNLSRIRARLWDDLAAAGAPLDGPTAGWALFEFSEFHNRQAKYVLGNQRSYEVFGWDWRLPLWDKDYLDFWERVPLSLKFNQRLYHEMLVEANWGGVWTSLLPAPRWITPSWIRPLRHAVHLACLPFGNEAWTHVDRRFFNHLTDPLRKYSAVPYARVAFGPTHRNAVSWLTVIYLECHGLMRQGRRL